MPILIFSLTCFTSYGQTDLKKPEASQAASVSQRIGLTDITINYHSPLAKGRTIWGELVPYNEVWRAGANENTTLAVSTDVTIEGQLLKAGKYGLHMIPGEKEWTIIFSKNADAWGSFFYSQKEDVLRVKTTAFIAPAQDWLSYTFTSPASQSVTAELHWEKLVIPIKISVDVPETVYQSMKQELTNINGFFWQGHNQAASYCIDNNIHLDEAMVWIDRSIGIQKVFPNQLTKARLLAKQGKQQEADAMTKEAFALADEAQLNTYGYELMGKGKTKEAIDIFNLNIKKFPGSWNAYDSLGEAMLASGDKKNALIQYKTALAKSPDNQKKRIEDIIKKM